MKLINLKTDQVWLMKGFFFHAKYETFLSKDRTFSSIAQILTQLQKTSFHQVLKPLKASPVVSKEVTKFRKSPHAFDKFMLNLWLETLNLKTTLRTDYVVAGYTAQQQQCLDRRKQRSQMKETPLGAQPVRNNFGEKGAGSSQRHARCGGQPWYQERGSSARSAE